MTGENDPGQGVYPQKTEPGTPNPAFDACGPFPGDVENSAETPLVNVR